MHFLWATVMCWMTTATPVLHLTWGQAIFHITALSGGAEWAPGAPTPLTYRLTRLPWTSASLPADQPVLWRGLLLLCANLVWSQCRKPSTLVTFHVVMTKCLTENIVGQEGWFWLTVQVHRDRDSMAAGTGSQLLSWVCQEAEGNQEVRQGYKTSRSASSDPLPSTKHWLLRFPQLLIRHQTLRTCCSNRWTYISQHNTRGSPCDSLGCKHWNHMDVDRSADLQTLPEPSSFRAHDLCPNRHSQR